MKPRLSRIRRRGRPADETVALFDAEWYREQLAAARIAAAPTVEHYLAAGADLGLSPSPLFDDAWYRLENPDVVDLPFTPFEHYAEFGWREQRSPHPLFDVPFYFRRNSQVNKEVTEPVHHYRTVGWVEMCDPHPLFSTNWYVTNYGRHLGDDVDPLSHYVARGWRLGFDPNSVFDTEWYVDQHPELVDGSQDPLTHFVTRGWTRGDDPAPGFSIGGYARRYPGCGGPRHALAHYLVEGRAGGLAAVPSEAFVPMPDRRTDVSVIGEIPRADSARSVAVIAAHDRRGIVGAATRHLARSFREAGVAVVLTCDHPLMDPDATLGDVADAVVCSEHEGYDFFSWRLALERFEPHAAFDELFLFNDSVVGPFADMRGFLARWRGQAFDVSGVIESAEPYPHLQSWGLRFGSRAAVPGTILGHYGKARPSSLKSDLIEKLEVPLSGYFRDRGFSVGSLFSPIASPMPSSNPMVFGWDFMLDAGLPFIKREVAALPATVTRARLPEIVERIRRVSGWSEDAITAILNDSLAQIGADPI